MGWHAAAAAPPAPHQEQRRQTCPTEQDQSCSMQVANCKLQVANCKSKVASCMLQVPAGQFAGKLPAQVDKLPVEQGTTTSARDFFTSSSAALSSHNKNFHTFPCPHPDGKNLGINCRVPQPLKWPPQSSHLQSNPLILLTYPKSKWPPSISSPSKMALTNLLICP